MREAQTLLFFPHLLEREHLSRLCLSRGHRLSPLPRTHFILWSCFFMKNWRFCSPHYIKSSLLCFCLTWSHMWMLVSWASILNNRLSFSKYMESVFPAFILSYMSFSLLRIFLHAPYSFLYFCFLNLLVLQLFNEAELNVTSSMIFSYLLRKSELFLKKTLFQNFVWYICGSSN